jgi:hypothetical protein
MGHEVRQHRWGVFLNDFDQDTVVWEGMSNPVPGGSARKSTAIIPFVNESLTSGLPIGSAPKRLMNSALPQTARRTVREGAGDFDISKRANWR